ncbi:MAG: serine acetyltransferase, partial [Treponema sp.]|nr:serine acetyltransferase [Treponema sp.]
MQIDQLIENILESYEKDGGINKAGNENFPNRENVVSILHDIQCLIFPGYKTAEELDSVNIRYITGQRVNRIISLLTKEIQKALTYKSIQHDENAQVKESHCFALAEKTALAMIEAIPEIRRLARLDAIAAYNGDPAAKSGDEVIVSYPGLEAIIVYRIAHFLHANGVPVIPRIMSEHVHGKTGIDI